MASRGNMSLTRHFTKSRRGGSDVSRSAIGSIRNKISGPVELIHTTNLLSYNAPDIVSRSASSTSTPSTKSDDDSDSTAPTSASVASSPPTSPDIASKDRTPSPQPNHLSCYFMPPSVAPTKVAPTKAAPAPVIPQRAPSRTSKHTEIISRQPSISRFSNLSSKSTSTKASSTFSRASSASTATAHSSIFAAPKPPPATPLPPPPVSYTHHIKNVSEPSPFGHELAQVAEIAEDYGVKDRLNLNNAEEKEMRKLGLRKFSAEDYISEIQSLVSGLFAEPKPLASMWI